jgi:hypothetical protein
MLFAALIELRDSLEAMLHQIRSERHISSPVFTCPKCGRRWPMADPRVSVRAMILALGRFGIMSAAAAKSLERGHAPPRGSALGRRTDGLYAPHYRCGLYRYLMKMMTSSAAYRRPPSWPSGPPARRCALTPPLASSSLPLQRRPAFRSSLNLPPTVSSPLPTLRHLPASPLPSPIQYRRVERKGISREFPNRRDPVTMGRAEEETT